LLKLQLELQRLELGASPKFTSRELQSLLGRLVELRTTGHAQAELAAGLLELVMQFKLAAVLLELVLSC
jgi:hypothetical protein